MNEQPFSFQSNGVTVSAVINVPEITPSPVVILLHGGTNTKYDCPLFDRMVPLLNASSIATLRFDFYGTGESDGLFQEKSMRLLDQNIADAIEVASKDERFTSIGLFGRSLSGGQVLYWNDDRIKARAVQSASIHPFADISRFYPEEIKGLLEHPEKDTALITSDPRTVKGEYAYSRELIEGFQSFPAKAAQNMPTLANVCVLQGDNDPETTVEEAIEIYQTLHKPKELHVISGANHKYVGSEEEASFLTVSWFKRMLLGS